MRGQISAGGTFHEGIFYGEVNSQGVIFSGKILHWENLPEFLNEIFVKCLVFLFADSMRGAVHCNCLG